MKPAAILFLAFQLGGAAQAAERPAAMTDHQRIEALEQRVKDLEFGIAAERLLQASPAATAQDPLYGEPHSITVGPPPIKQCTTVTEGNSVTTRCK